MKTKRYKTFTVIITILLFASFYSVILLADAGMQNSSVFGQNVYIPGTDASESNIKSFEEAAALNPTVFKTVPADMSSYEDGVTKPPVLSDYFDIPPNGVIYNNDFDIVFNGGCWVAPAGYGDGRDGGMALESDVVPSDNCSFTIERIGIAYDFTVDKAEMIDLHVEINYLDFWDQASTNGGTVVVYEENDGIVKIFTDKIDEFEADFTYTYSATGLPVEESINYIFRDVDYSQGISINKNNLNYLIAYSDPTYDYQTVLAKPENTDITNATTKGDYNPRQDGSNWLASERTERLSIYESNGFVTVFDSWGNNAGNFGDGVAGKTETVGYESNFIMSVDSEAQMGFNYQQDFIGRDYTQTSQGATLYLEPYSENVLVDLTKGVTDANGDGIASDGETLTYTITVSNLGSMSTEVTVTDLVDDPNLDASTISNLTVMGYLIAEPTNIYAVPYTGDLQTGITFTIDSKEKVEVSFDVVVDYATDPPADSISNLATLDSEYCWSDGTDTGCEGTTTIPTEDFEMTKTNVQNDDSIVDPGETLVYEIAVINTGVSDLTNVVVTDPLDDPKLDSTSSSVVSVTDSSGAAVDYVGTDLTQGVVISSIPVGETVTVTFTVNATDPLEVTGDPDPENIVNTATACYETHCEEDTEIIPLVGTPDFIMEKNNTNNPDGAASPGEVLNYEILVTNTGEMDLTNVVVTDPLDDPHLDSSTVQIISVTYSDGTAANYSGDILTGLVIENIPIGETVTIAFTVEAVDPFSSDTVEIVNTASACYEAIGCKDDTVVIPGTTGIDYIVEKNNINNSDSSVTSGETLMYQIVVTNTGAEDIYELVITDPLSDPNFDTSTLEIVSVTYSDDSEVSYSGDLLTGMVIDFLPVGESVIVTFTVDAVENLTSSEVLNTVTASVPSENIEKTADEEIPVPVGDTYNNITNTGYSFWDYLAPLLVSMFTLNMWRLLIFLI